MIYIRKTTKVQELKFLDREIFPEDERLNFRLNENWLLFYVDSPIGFGSLKPLRREKACFLSRAGILQDFRGFSLHKRLVRARTRWAKARGFDKVVTYTKQTNVGSANNLLDLNFRLYLPQNPYADEDCIYFYKNL